MSKLGVKKANKVHFRRKQNRLYCKMGFDEGLPSIA